MGHQNGYVRWIRAYVRGFHFTRGKVALQIEVQKSWAIKQLRQVHAKHSA
jgi:hypothetical protein